MFIICIKLKAAQQACKWTLSRESRESQDLNVNFQSTCMRSSKSEDEDVIWSKAPKQGSKWPLSWNVLTYWMQHETGFVLRVVKPPPYAKADEVAGRFEKAGQDPGYMQKLVCLLQNNKSNSDKRAPNWNPGYTKKPKLKLKQTN